MENKFLKLINDKKFIDNTDVIKDILHESYNVISNMTHTGGSAFTFMVILDSLEAILSGKELTCNSSLFCQYNSVLVALERGRC